MIKTSLNFRLPEFRTLLTTNTFNTIQEGYDLLLRSGTLNIAEGNYSIGNLSLNKRMTIPAAGGTITIGY